MLEPIEAENLKALTGIRHGFFTREGGVSAGIYAALNCGLGSSDDRATVLENRARVARHLGAHDERVVTLHQTHSATALVIERAPSVADLPKADAVVTNTPGLVIGALAADCAPVLMADAQANVVAAVHAGWRGAVSGIVQSAIAAMESLGSQRSNICAAVGPCINQTSYEVGAEFEAELVALNTLNSRFFLQPAPSARPHFDLAGFVAAQLMDAGIVSVEMRVLCTFENESKFFSFRRSKARSEPDYGRQISAIVVA